LPHLLGFERAKSFQNPITANISVDRRERLGGTEDRQQTASNSRL
jgi:hypothetical protein